MNIINRIICFFYGHLRGKLLHRDQTHKTFACPRCKRTTTYPIKPS